MATWLSTHGIGAIKDSESTFIIVADRGSALVKPTEVSGQKGYIHFTLPSPPVNNPNLKTVAIDFSSQEATVERVEVYLANNEVFRKERLQKGQSFKLPIASAEAVYQGQGLAVSVYVEFVSMTSTLHFQSVAVEV